MAPPTASPRGRPPTAPDGAPRKPTPAGPRKPTPAGPRQAPGRTPALPPLHGGRAVGVEGEGGEIVSYICGAWRGLPIPRGR
ncbi:Adenylate cyclase [Actinacidiphila bryophytorum]|uniref:Adenylate cyclase n=1 Tax=Actinacidiphila bryophytorum TaxID=1436133 RepID=A0A9W4E5U3_9ACTN|nr:Adenylate cyclase [Actinacidiphila bryophytorum]